MTMPERSVMSCPVDGCAWTLSQADVELKVPLSLKWRPGETLDEAISENSRRWHARVEEMIRGHLETHDVMEWLQTVRRLEQELYNAGPTGVRPHRRLSDPLGHEVHHATLEGHTRVFGPDTP